MKSNKKDYFGILINNKVPTKKDKENKVNKYYGNIKLKFEGKAFIVNKQNLKVIDEIKPNIKLKNEGRYTIKFINEKNEIYFIEIEIKKLLAMWLFLFCLFILFGGIILFNTNSNVKYKINEFMNFDLELEGLKYVFDINYKDNNFQSVQLTDKVNKKNIIYPGSSGSFYVIISTKNGNKDMKYLMEVKEETNKPTNLKYKFNGTIYDSITELANSINGNINKNSSETIKIDWFWDYESLDDKIDTNEGINNETYKFLIRMIGNEKE